MPDSDLPCLEMLEATPEILRGLMCEISDEDARWKPAADRFSIAEVLAHMSHSEGHCYGMRLDRFMAEDFPSFEGDDAQMHLALYPQRRSGGCLRSLRRTTRDQSVISAEPASGGWRSQSKPRGSRRDYPLPDAARMDAA